MRRSDDMPRLHAMLYWNEGQQRWQGADGSRFIWMSRSTMDKYATAWLEAQCVAEPTPAQKKAAEEHCRRISYYNACIDPQVHIVESARVAAQRRGH